MDTLPKNKLTVIALAICLSLLVASCDSLPWVSETSTPTPLPPVVSSGVVNAEGRVVPVDSAALGFPTGGELAELLVSVGDTVKQGDVLARLGQREPLEAAVRQAEMELLSAQQALDDLNDTAALAREQSAQALVDVKVALNEAQHSLNELDTDDFQEELDDLNISVQDAQDDLDDAKETLDKYLDLDPDNTTRRNAQDDYDDALDTYTDAVYDRDVQQYRLDAAQAAVELASASLDDAQRKFDLWKDGPDPDQLAIAESRVAAAQAQLAAAQRALENTDLTAPYDGTIIDVSDVQPGEKVPAGFTLLTLADLSSWMVETRDLTELDVVDVKPGQEVEIMPDALPDLTLKGTVESIDQVFTERSGDILYTVRIRLSENDPRLRWGMTVNAVFEK